MIQGYQVFVNLYACLLESKFWVAKVNWTVGKDLQDLSFHNKPEGKKQNKKKIQQKAWKVGQNLLKSHTQNVSNKNRLDHSSIILKMRKDETIGDFQNKL